MTLKICLLKDLGYLIDKDCSVKIFTAKNPEGLETIPEQPLPKYELCHV